jgi:hypothetical protein
MSLGRVTGKEGKWGTRSELRDQKLEISDKWNHSQGSVRNETVAPDGARIYFSIE